MAKWSEVKTLKDQIEDTIFEINGVNYIDIETEFLPNDELGEAVLLVGTEDTSKIPAITRAVKPLVGDFEFRVIEFKIMFTDSATPNETLTNTVKDLAQYRPLIGGCAIGMGANGDHSNKWMGTLGVFIPSTFWPFGFVGLTNQHVVGNFEDIYQPPIPRGMQPPIPKPIMTSSPNGDINSNIDANFCMFNEYAGAITREVLYQGVVRGVKPASLAMPVSKTGFMSGKTNGKITSTTVSLNYSGEMHGKPFTAIMKNQIQIKSSDTNPFQIKGDSGAVLVSSFGGDSVNLSVCLTGLMYAVDGNGNGYACHINKVLDQFDLSLPTYVPFYEFIGNGDHFYTTNYYMADGTGGRAGYNFTEIVCNVWATAADAENLIPLYRWFCPINGDHLYTINSNEKPDHYNYEGIACYIMQVGSQQPSNTKKALVNLYRWYNPSTCHHMISTTAQPKAGFQSEGIIGMVLSETIHVNDSFLQKL